MVPPTGTSSFRRGHYFDRSQSRPPPPAKRRKTNDTTGSFCRHSGAKEHVKREKKLIKRIRLFDDEKNNEILVTIDGNKITQQDSECIQQLSEILSDSGEIGSFELGNLHVDVIQINTFEKELIKL